MLIWTICGEEIFGHEHIISCQDSVFSTKISVQYTRPKIYNEFDCGNCDKSIDLLTKIC